MANNETISVLFVCLGNICRSPTAEAIFRAEVHRNNLQDRLQIDSCGTGDWHIGHAPDSRTVEAAKRRDYDLSALRARQFSLSDFDKFDYILAMDQQNLNDLTGMRPPGFAGELDLFLGFAGLTRVSQVPDPYYGGEQGFEQVLDLVEEGATRLLEKLAQRHQFISGL